METQQTIDAMPLGHLKKKYLIYQSCYRFTAKLSGRYEISQYVCPYIPTSLIINLTHQSGTLFTTDGPTLTDYYTGGS